MTTRQVKLINDLVENALMFPLLEVELAPENRIPERQNWLARWYAVFRGEVAERLSDEIFHKIVQFGFLA